ncbi:MAG: molybdopterin molybdotransferase MoeA [Oscillibacter sp.]|nr:molybdopterin molybdotransferase MoeA [Oscillibacter sp.]
MSITVEEAIRLVMEHTPVLPEEQVPLLQSIGRTLTQEVRSAIVQPPFDRSPLDGYAVIAADAEHASSEQPAVLQVVEKLYAGQATQLQQLQRGQAVRLMTGCMIPAGADCIIRQEDTDEGEDTVRIYKGVKSGSNYCYKGEEYGEGALLLPVGQKVDAGAVALAASAGLTQLSVRRRPRVAILTTGDEVQQPGQPLSPGKIYNSNTSYLTARLIQLNTEVVVSRIVGDEMGALLEALEDCARGADLILTTGGVSVGQKDLTDRALREFGADILFHGIAMKPGMPTLFAKKDSTLILGLSGNPFSAAVPFELLFHTMLSRMVEDPALALRRETVLVGSDFLKRSPSQRFLRAVCENGVVTMPTEQSNGQIRSMVGCNCLVDVPAGTAAVRTGDRISIIWL